MKNLLLILAAASFVTGSVIADDKIAGAKAASKDDAKADIKIVITGNDTMKYDTEKFEVTTGQVVALTLKNIGTLPVQAMGHNLVILKPGTDIPTFAMAGMTNQPGGYLPKGGDFTKFIIAKIKVLGPKEEETIVFKAGAPGDYPYICTFPGHFALMKGVMKVKAK
jgi:azurin